MWSHNVADNIEFTSVHCLSRSLESFKASLSFTTSLCPSPKLLHTGSSWFTAIVVGIADYIVLLLPPSFFIFCLNLTSRYNHPCMTRRVDRRNGCCPSRALHGITCCDVVYPRSRFLCLYTYVQVIAHSDILPFLSFLNRLFDSDSEKQAVLTCMALSTAIAFAHALLEQMIPGQYHTNPPLTAPSQTNSFKKLTPHRPHSPLDRSTVLQLSALWILLRPLSSYLITCIRDLDSFLQRMITGARVDHTSQFLLTT